MPPKVLASSDPRRRMGKRIEPSEPPSLSAMIKMVASLGGYVIRSNTKPGTQSLWLGLQRLGAQCDSPASA